MVEATLREHKEIFTEFALIGLGTSGQVNQGTVVRMVPRHERSITQQEILPSCARNWPRSPVRVFAPYPMVQGQRGTLQFVLAGETSRKSAACRELQQEAGGRTGMGGRIDTDLQLDLPQLIFQPDRLRIAASGLTTNDVAQAINMLSGGVDIAKYNDEPGDGQRYDIRVKGRESEFRQPSDLAKIWLRNREGKIGAPRFGGDLQRKPRLPP